MYLYELMLLYKCVECIDNLYGCLEENMSKKEEAENP